MNNNPNNTFNNEENKPIKKKQKEYTSLNEDEVKKLLEEAQKLVKNKLHNPKDYERLIELIKILSDYIPMEKLEQLLGRTQNPEDDVKHTFSISSNEFGYVGAFVINTILSDDYPEFKDNPKITNIVSSVMAGIWTIIYNEYKKSLLNHGVKLPERRKHFDYTKIRNKSRQYYFDSLFDKDTYCELVRKMVCDVGDENITFSKLWEIEYHPIDYSVDKDQTEESLLQRVYDGIVTNENDNRVVIDTITAISDWKTYAICKGSELLERKPKIEISHEQKEIFRQYCCEQLKEIDFSKEIFDEGNGISYTFRAVRVIFLSVYFDFVYDKETIFKMLMVPPYFFRAEENFVEGRVPQYISGKVTEIELAEQIKCNLSGKQMCSDVADMHITYCKDNNLDWAVPLAKTICSDQNSHSWSKRSAIEYLEKVNGFEYVYDNFLDSSDEKIIESIISVTLKYKNERLRKRLEELCRESLDGRRFLATLITLSSKYGLQRYAEIIKCDMKATDIKDNTIIDTIIEAIGGVNDINLLDEIGDLQKILFLPGFEDRTHFGLRNAIYKAYQNMERNNEEKMREYIDALLQNPEISDDEKGFCNSLLLDFEYAHNQREDVAWSIDEVKEFMKESC